MLTRLTPRSDGIAVHQGGLAVGDSVIFCPVDPADLADLKQEVKGSIISTNGRYRDNRCIHQEYHGTVLNPHFYEVCEIKGKYAPYCGKRLVGSHLALHTQWSGTPSGYRGNKYGVIPVPIGSEASYTWNHEPAYDRRYGTWTSTTVRYGCTNVGYHYTILFGSTVYQEHSGPSDVQGTVIAWLWPLDTTQELPEQPTIHDISHHEERVIKMAGASPADFGASFLACDAINDMQYLDINTTTALSGLLEFPKFMSSWLTGVGKTLKSMSEKDLKKTLSGASDAYLGWIYGVETTKRDIADLSANFITSLNQMMFNPYRLRVGRARRTSVVGNLRIIENYTVRARTPHGFRGLLNDLQSLDFWPELENLWDLVPYSFVVDWLLPVGDVLKTWDMEFLLSNLEVHSCVYSRKIIRRMTVNEVLHELGGYPIGDITETIYHRDPSNKCAPINHELSAPSSFNNWLPAGALITQRVAR